MVHTFTLRETAQRLGIKVRTAREWVHQGKLHAEKSENGRRWLVPESEVERKIAEKNKKDAKI